MKHTKLCLLLPCYNEEDVIEDSFHKLEDLYTALIDKHVLDKNSFFSFIDDGSSDNTWEIIVKLKAQSQRVRAIKLSKNFGHQNALLAGLSFFKDTAECYITMDVDLQDDLNVIEQMIKRFNEGYEIVYGIKKRKGETFFKKNTAQFFYKMMKLMGVPLVFNHADCRLSSNRVLNELSHFKEYNLFLRGIYQSIGFKSTSLEYFITDRKAGHTKYSFSKMLSLAVKGVTSFTMFPLRVISVVGMFIFLLSILGIFYSIYSYIFLDAVKGWMSVVLPIYFLGGIQLLFIGLIGEYLGKIYSEVKQRPRYIIESEL